MIFFFMRLAKMPLTKHFEDERITFWPDFVMDTVITFVITTFLFVLHLKMLQWNILHIGAASIDILPSIFDFEDDKF